MNLKESLILYLKALLLFGLIVLLSSNLVKSGFNHNDGLMQIGYLTYWGLVFLADTINNKKTQ